MAYGRLEVYWPDGRIETYWLEADTVSVGRAEGNTISLDTETISRYHFSIVRENEERVSITDLDSANGTFVDGTPLKANEPFELDDVEEIMLGSLRIIYRFGDDTATISLDADLDSTQRIEGKENQIRLEMDTSELQVWPASSSSTELAITNLGTETRTLAIRVNGIPSGWLRLTRPEVEIDPGETAYILLRVLPPRRPNTVPQLYKVSVEVAPIEQPELAIAGELNVEIHPYVGFGMAIGQQVDDGEAIPVYLHNQGSGLMRVSLRAYDKQKFLKFNLPNTPIELQAGQRLRIDLNVEAINPPITGSIKSHTFIAEVKSHEASQFIAATEGKVLISPRIPLWAALSGLGVSVLIIMIGIFALFNTFKPGELVINNIVFNQSPIEQGMPLEITIDADNAKTVDVLIMGDVYSQEMEDDTTTISVDTSEYEGTIEVEVIARRSEESIREVNTVVIYVPIAEGLFVASPPQLIRYMVNTIDITWDIPGAKEVQIRGLSSFNSSYTDSQVYTGSFTLESVGGIPTETLQLSLVATDLAGDSIEMSLVAPIIDPQCTAMTDVPIYEGPNEGFQQVATVPISTSVVVTAQDGGAGWVRVLLPGDIRGWGNGELFSCPDTFSIDKLEVAVNIPEIPTEIPTTAPTATPETETTEEAG